MRKSAVVPLFALVGIGIAIGIVVRDIALGSATARAQEARAALGAHVFEMRTYTTQPGRLEALHARFREHTNYLFVKHGMKLIGYWTPVDKPDTLVYILAYASREAREKSWKAFLDDAEWKRVFKESHERAGGAIVKQVESVFLDPTDYSPLR